MNTRVSSKGQVVLPKTLRDELDWSAGTDLIIERQENGVFLRRKNGVKPTTIDQVIGMFKVDHPISDEAIERGIEAGYRARWLRKR